MRAHDPADCPRDACRRREDGLQGRRRRDRDGGEPAKRSCLKLKEAVDAKLLPAAAMETTAQFFETPPTLQRVSGVRPSRPQPHGPPIPTRMWCHGTRAMRPILHDARGTAPVRIDQSQVVADRRAGQRGGHPERPRAARGHECRLVQARRRRPLCGSDGPGLRETGGQAGKSAGERDRHRTRERVDRT